MADETKPPIALGPGPGQPGTPPAGGGPATVIPRSIENFDGIKGYIEHEAQFDAGHKLELHKDNFHYDSDVRDAITEAKNHGTVQSNSKYQHDGKVIDVKRRTERLEAAEKRLERARERGTGDLKIYEKEIEEIKKEMKSTAKEDFEALLEGKKLRNDALTAIDKDRNNAIKEADEFFRDQRSTLSDMSEKLGPVEYDARLKQLDTKQRKFHSAVEKHYDNLGKPLRKEVDAIENTVKELETATELKSADLVKKSSLSAAKAGEQGVGRIAQFKKNWKSVEEGGKGKFGMIVGSVFAGGLIIDGFRRLGKAAGILSPNQDENGKEVPAGSGGIVMGLGEIVGGGAIYGLYLSKGKGAAK